MKLLVDKISTLQSKISKSIYGINFGGCIHFAYYFSKRLKELNIDHKIVFTDYVPINLSYDQFTSVSHVAVYIKNIGYIDGEDIHEDTSFKKQYIRHVKVSTKKLDAFRNGYEWNDEYDIFQNSRLEILINKYITNA